MGLKRGCDYRSEGRKELNAGMKPGWWRWWMDSRYLPLLYHRAFYQHPLSSFNLITSSTSINPSSLLLLLPSHLQPQPPSWLHRPYHANTKQVNHSAIPLMLHLTTHVDAGYVIFPFNFNPQAVHWVKVTNSSLYDSRSETTHFLTGCLQQEPTPSSKRRFISRRASTMPARSSTNVWWRVGNTWWGSLNDDKIPSFANSASCSTLNQVRNEINVLKKISAGHPNIVTLHDVCIFFSSFTVPPGHETNFLIRTNSSIRRPIVLRDVEQSLSGHRPLPGWWTLWSHLCKRSVLWTRCPSSRPYRLERGGLPTFSWNRSSRSVSYWSLRSKFFNMYSSTCQLTLWSSWTFGQTWSPKTFCFVDPRTTQICWSLTLVSRRWLMTPNSMPSPQLVAHQVGTPPTVFPKAHDTHAHRPKNLV